MTARPLLGADRLDELLAGCAGRHVAVLGDLAVDAYWTADMRMSELSRETPLPVRPVAAETYSPGGGAHVARSLRVLGCRVSAFSVIGTDWRGDLLLRLLADADVETAGVQRTDGVRTVLFGKVLLSAGDRQQEDARLDFVNDRPADPDVEAGLLAALDAVLPDLHALVVSDYQPVGVVGETVTAWLRGVRATRPGLPLVVDSRDRIGGFDDMVRTPNRHEAAAYFETRTGSTAPADDDAALLTALSALLPADAAPMVVTLDRTGCAVVAAGRYDVVPIVPVDGGDAVGAGDAFLAGLAAALASDAPVLEAAAFANLAAAATVTQCGTTGEPRPALMRGLNARP